MVAFRSIAEFFVSLGVKILAVVVLTGALALGYQWYCTKNIKRFCAELRVGSPRSEVLRNAETLVL